MTTFAAVLTDGCRLSLEPLHPWDPPGPIVLPGSGVTVAGSVLLESPAALANDAGAPGEARALAIVGAAYLRWGRRFTERLSGEYAFALWDPRERHLLCARDALGIRRLYIAEGPGTIIATNQLAIALAHPAIDNALDGRTVASFLSNGSIRDVARTFYEHVRVLPPGHTLAIDAAGERPELFRHWVPTAPRVRANDDVAARYREALVAAVRDRVGPDGCAILLSGGIDSTTVAAAAVEAGSHGALHAVTCAYSAGVGEDEVPCARAAAHYLSIPIEEVAADVHPPLAAAWEGAPLPQPVDEPTLADWRALVRAAARHSTVVLHGEDGDSLLCPPGLGSMLAAQSALSIAAATARFVVRRGRLPYLGIRLRERLGLAKPRALGPLPAWLTPEARRAIQKGPPATVLGHAPVGLEPHPFRPETFKRLANVASALAPTIAVETTAVKAELRYPLLDARVLSVVLSAPPIPWLQAKHLPRAAFAGRLPDRVIRRPKTPLAGAFEASVAAWRAGGSAWSPAAGLEEWVDVAALKATLERGTRDEIMAGWRALLVSAWLDRRAEVEAACTR